MQTRVIQLATFVLEKDESRGEAVLRAGAQRAYSG